MLLPLSLKKIFPEGALVRVRFVEKPELPFFIRGNAEYYSERLKTVSLAKAVLTAAGVKGHEKRAKLDLADEAAATLKQMVMVISDVFLSKRLLRQAVWP